jgi:undecaprenyl diphosphate synthase
MADPAHVSSTQAIPSVGAVPRHVAIIMDGNGRWARKRLLPRVAGHRKGVEAVRETVSVCREYGVEYLTLFAFSSENWRRPADEVSFLMQLFMRALESEVDKLDEADVRLRVIGDRTAFDRPLQDLIAAAEQRTGNNRKLQLTIAANYGGRWDIVQAMQQLARSGQSNPDEWTEAALAQHLSMAFAPEPDLFIRTGGEQRISNFLLWQLAYTELHFTPTLWPEFGRGAFDAAIASYRKRERRFGRTSEQLYAATGEAKREAG